MKKTCKECQKEFIGRMDAKFCSSDCRSSFHNKKNRGQRKMVRSINKVLWNNRQILRSLNPEGKASVHKSKLTERGFNFKYFTNIFETKSGNVYHFCYDLGYFDAGNGYLTLVVRQEYVD
ncbi:MAG TPA: hypothetical protein VJ917_10300 [Saprospiraceae bacterium]|nr:hypothetical protein [Saprospiraceae bacterium]